MNTYVIDKPVLYSQLSAENETKENIARKLCDRCNELGKMEIFVEPDTDVINEVKETVEETTVIEEVKAEIEAEEAVNA
jgi:Zn ribbon nucleic-acid-binding protein